jgi:hypothetical protein
MRVVTSKTRSQWGEVVRQLEERAGEQRQEDALKTRLLALNIRQANVLFGQNQITMMLEFDRDDIDTLIRGFITL